MKLENFKIKKLFGYLNKEIIFHQDISLLVGINGAGKTTILNLLNWMLKPSIADLCMVSFASIELNFTFKNTNYTIKCIQQKKTLRYTVSTKEKSYPSLKVPLKIHPTEIPDNSDIKNRLKEDYERLFPSGSEIETWKLVSTFPNPTVIGLDRSIYTEELSGIYTESTLNLNYNKRRLQNKSITPLDRTKNIIDNEYKKRKSQMSANTEDLKRFFMLSNFEDTITLDSLTWDKKSMLRINQIESVENRVYNYFNNYEDKKLSENELGVINNYFSHLKSILSEYQSNPEDNRISLLYALNASQFKKVNRLLEKLEKFEQEAIKLMRPITNFFDTINFFFKDSAKYIGINPNTYELYFSNTNQKGEIIKEYNDINSLSSGEQQILVLYSYIAFNSRGGQVFIIDEPELSLHIKWQEDFLSQLEKITPSQTQLILATHSPILANKKKDKAIVLLPYND